MSSLGEQEFRDRFLFHFFKNPLQALRKNSKWRLGSSVKLTIIVLKLVNFYLKSWLFIEHWMSTDSLTLVCHTLSLSFSSLKNEQA